MAGARGARDDSPTGGDATSVWAKPPRQPRAKLTREQIVSEAIRLLDTEGSDALSMRKLASRLGSGATSIYWHVASRDDLIELVIDEVYAEVELPDMDEATDWRSAVTHFARSVRSGIVRHPWMVSVLDHISAGIGGPNANLLTERLLAVFEGAGFELREAERALNTVSSYVLGVALAEAAWHTGMARHDQTQQEWVDQTQHLAAEVSDEFPRLRALVAQYDMVDVGQTMEDDFAYGLDRVLDGLEVRLSAIDD